MGGRPAVDHPVPASFGAGEDDLVLDSGQGGLAAGGLVPQGIVLHVLQHAGDPDAGQRLKRGLLGFAGNVGIPDLEGSGDVPAVGAQQPDGVLVDEASPLREAGEHPALGQQFPEKICRRALRDRMVTAVSGIATDRMVLSMPNRATAAGSGTKSKVRHVPLSTPTWVPYSSTARSATGVLPGGDGCRQLHAGFAHRCEEAIHQY